MTSVRKKKILILGNSHLVVFKFRGELISTLVERDMMFGYVSPMDHLGRENRQPRYTDAILLKIKWNGEVQIQLKIWNL